MLLDGCRFAQSIHSQRLEMGKFRLKLRRLGILEEEIFDHPGFWEPGTRT